MPVYLKNWKDDKCNPYRSNIYQFVSSKSTIDTMTKFVQPFSLHCVFLLYINIQERRE